MRYLLIILISSLLCWGCGKRASTTVGSSESSTSSPSNPNTPPSTPPTTPPTTPPSTPPSNSFKLSCMEAQFVQLINIYRQQNNLTPLIPVKSATLSSRWHSQNMIDLDYMSHTEPNGRTFSERAYSFGYVANGENIAGGQVSAREVFCGWKNSPGHNANMLRSSYRTTGIGVVKGGTYKIYWSNNFGPSANDQLVQPYTNDSGCSLDSSLPVCN